MNSQLKLYEVKIHVPTWLSKNVVEIVRATSEDDAREQIEKHSIYPLQEYTIISVVSL